MCILKHSNSSAFRFILVMSCYWSQLARLTAIVVFVIWKNTTMHGTVLLLWIGVITESFRYIFWLRDMFCFGYIFFLASLLVLGSFVLVHKFSNVLWCVWCTRAEFLPTCLYHNGLVCVPYFYTRYILVVRVEHNTLLIWISLHFCSFSDVSWRIMLDNTFHCLYMASDYTNR